MRFAYAPALWFSTQKEEEKKFKILTVFVVFFVYMLCVKSKALMHNSKFLSTRGIFMSQNKIFCYLFSYIISSFHFITIMLYNECYYLVYGYKKKNVIIKEGGVRKTIFPTVLAQKILLTKKKLIHNHGLA